MIACILILSACNPFAPSKDNNLVGDTFLADQTNPEGVFENWSLAYNYRDTLIYARVLSDDFTFYYRNFDLGIDQSWDRETDIRKTHGLFETSQYIDLVWNEYLLSEGDSLNWNASRQFYLQITFSDNDIVTLSGRANVKLVRKNELENWKILEWSDETNF
ncbi:hypothetical protein OAQ99_02460 [Candidatus Kapabacteria bacterium]|nr:hypothetical protein [Candidatus Kapabacteria bacterium]